MQYRTILVPLSGGDIGRSPLEAAFAVARQFEAHVEVLHVRPDPRNMIPYVGEGMSGALIEEVMGAAEREAGERADSAHHTFEEIVTREGVQIRAEPDGPGLSAHWREESGREDESVARFGRTADLVVVSRPVKEAEVPTSTVFEAALFESGQPLLVAPPQPVSIIGQRVMIAWNGSPEAARAVTHGIPFLRGAEHVHILSVVSWGEGPTSVAGVARRLGWHGIRATVETIDEPVGTVGETVVAEAGRFGADLIVMGAYTQSRLRQMILGGVTRHLLSTASVPLLMAH